MKTTEHRVMDTLAAQRNTALDAAAVAAAQRDEAADQRLAVFIALDQCIKSGQVPQEAVPTLVGSVPGFSEWRETMAT
jgi:hypothetical protein